MELDVFYVGVLVVFLIYLVLKLCEKKNRDRNTWQIFEGNSIHDWDFWNYSPSINFKKAVAACIVFFVQV